MNEIFNFYFEQAEIRIVKDADGEPRWIASDVCKILGYNHTPSAIRRLDDDEFSQVTPNVRPTHSGPPPRPFTVVNEAGLYNLILGSKKPEAKRFRRWITSEVLPTIRKTGAYVEPRNELADALVAGDTEVVLLTLKTALNIAEEVQAKNAELTAQNAEMVEVIEQAAPKVKVAEEFFGTDGLMGIREAARSFGIPERRFSDILRDWSWIELYGNAGKAYAVKQGYVENKVYLIRNGAGQTISGKLTRKGVERAAIRLHNEGLWDGPPPALRK